MPNQRIGNHLSVYQVMTGAFMISFSGVYVKWAHVGPTMSGFYRVFLGGLILTAIGTVRKEPFWVNHKYLIFQIVCGATFALDLFFSKVFEPKKSFRQLEAIFCDKSRSRLSQTLHT